MRLAVPSTRVSNVSAGFSRLRKAPALLSSLPPLLAPGVLCPPCPWGASEAWLEDGAARWSWGCDAGRT